MSTNRSRSGFSIVEILIVVACLAILAAILLPMFLRMREAGYQTKCAANMQQIAAAFNTYSQDWSDYWPAPGGKAGDWTYWSQSGKGGLSGYIKQQGYGTVWCCPKMPEWTSKYPPRSYSMNSYLREPADVEYAACTSIIKGIRISNVSNMSKTILVFEGLPLTVGWEKDDYYIYIYRCCNWTGVKGFYPKLAYTIDPAHPWHGRFNNYLYTDGHLQARSPGRKTVGVLSTYKEMYEWYASKARFETEKWPVFARAGAPRE